MIFPTGRFRNPAHSVTEKVASFIDAVVSIAA